MNLKGYQPANQVDTLNALILTTYDEPFVEDLENVINTNLIDAKQKPSIPMNVMDIIKNE